MYAFDLYAELMAKRDEAAAFADEQADFSDGPASLIEREYRAQAGAFFEAAEMVRVAEDARRPLGVDQTPEVVSDLAGRFVQWSNSDCAAQCRV